MPSQASEFAPQQRRVNKIALPNTKNKKTRVAAELERGRIEAQ
jgi:hypothetical protein